MFTKRFLLISILVMTVLTAGCGVQQPPGEVPSINAVGTGKITTEPDTLEVRFTVVSEGKDKSVQSENAQKTQKVIDSLIAIGLLKEEMETQNISFNPMYEWDTKTGQRIVGYRAENSILITTEKLDKAGQITDTAVNNGATMVGNLAFSLSEEGKSQILDSAIEKAVEDARKQAEASAKAAGVSIQGVKRIDIQKQGQRTPVYFDNMKTFATKGESAMDTPVIPQDAEYIISVNVSFIIK